MQGGESVSDMPQAQVPTEDKPSEQLAARAIDEGDIYEQLILNYSGSELNTELKHKQGIATIELVLNFIKKYPINIKNN